MACIDPGLECEIEDAEQSLAELRKLSYAAK